MKKDIGRTLLHVSCEMQILERVAVLVLCHGLAAGQTIPPHYILSNRSMSWSKAREFCQKFYMDLAVLSTEEQYFALHNATAGHEHTFWLGMSRESILGDWRWVSGEDLSYEHWYRKNYEGHCASLEAMLQPGKDLLARYCEETHMFVCQGPVSPQPLMVDSVSSDHVVLSWNVSAFMQMTPHGYNVTTCTNSCDTQLLQYPTGSSSMNISINNLTSDTKYSTQVSALVLRPDSVTGGNAVLQSEPTALHFKTVNSGGRYRVLIAILKYLKYVSVAPAVWVLYRSIKEILYPSLCESKDSSDPEALEKLSTEETVVGMVPEKIRAVG